MIQQIRIQNFRSLKDVTLDLQQVNLLIGPNNSGKTNVLKALGGFIEILTFKSNPLVDTELYKRITFHNPVNDKDAVLREPIIFSVNFETNEINYFCHVELHNVDRRKGIIGVRYNEQPIANFRIGDDRQNLDNYFSRYRYFEEPNIAMTLRRTEFWTALLYLEGIFEELDVYRIDTAKLIQTGIPSFERRLDGDSSNIVPFIFSLSQNHRKRFRQLEDDLKRCVGDIISVSTPPDPIEEGKLKLKFFDTYDNEYWADEVSEGVLYFLALLCIIHQPDPPKLLLLEEPEKGIHPRRIREVLDFIFDLAQEKDMQVIITTHDTYVVDQFADIPEAVFVFDKKHGATEVKNLLNDIIEPANQLNRVNGLPPTHYTQSLGEHWAAGFLGGVPR